MKRRGLKEARIVEHKRYGRSYMGSIVSQYLGHMKQPIGIILFQKLILKYNFRARERALPLRSLVAFPEDIVFVLSIHIIVHNCLYNQCQEN